MIYIRLSCEKLIEEQIIIATWGGAAWPAQFSILSSMHQGQNYEKTFT